MPDASSTEGIVYIKFKVVLDLIPLPGPPVDQEPLTI